MSRLSVLAFRVTCVVVALAGGWVMTPTAFGQGDKLSMRDKLSTLIDTKDFDRPMTLTDAVKRIHDQCAAKGIQLIIRVDQLGIARLNQEPSPEEDKFEVRLPSDPRTITADEALRLLVGQVRPIRAAMLVRNGGVEILAQEDARLPALLRRNVRWRFGKVTFAEATAHLSDMTGANIVLDPRLGEEGAESFNNADLDRANSVYDDEVRLPVVPKVMTTATALRQALGQLKTPAAMVLRNGAVEILPKKAARPEALLQYKVLARFNKVPVVDALRQISELTGVSVAIDPRAAENAQANITADFRGDGSTEAALRMVAEMAELRVVLMDGGVYVTTPANAEGLEKRLRERKEQAPRSPASVVP